MSINLQIDRVIDTIDAMGHGMVCLDSEDFSRVFRGGGRVARTNKKQYAHVIRLDGPRAKRTAWWLCNDAFPAPKICSRFSLKLGYTSSLLP